MTAPSSIPSKITPPLTMLDNPVWHALTSAHSHFASGNDLIKRYPKEVTPLGGMPEMTEAGWKALAEMLSQDKSALAFFLDAKPKPPCGWIIINNSQIIQMVCQKLNPRPVDFEVQPLGAADAAEMVALAELTKPGPFGMRTHEMGTFLGVRRQGKIVAMAGQRLRLDGFTEISGVCTHPDHQGHGYAGGLVSILSNKVFEEGSIPFLHSRIDNVGALGLYEKLGFAVRREITLLVLKRDAEQHQISEEFCGH